MKKVYKLLQFLNDNDVKFNIELYDHDSGDLIIQTDLYTFRTYQFEHLVEILEEDGTLVDFELEHLQFMYS